MADKKDKKGSAKRYLQKVGRGFSKATKGPAGQKPQKRTKERVAEDKADAKAVLKETKTYREGLSAGFKSSLFGTHPTSKKTK